MLDTSESKTEQLPVPISRQDKLLHNIADGTPNIEDLVPISREEEYLKYIALNGTSLNIVQSTGTSTTAVMSQNAVTEELKKRPEPTIDVVQSTGTSTTAVMSQNAVTEELKKIPELSYENLGTAPIKYGGTGANTAEIARNNLNVYGIDQTILFTNGGSIDFNTYTSEGIYRMKSPSGSDPLQNAPEANMINCTLVVTKQDTYNNYHNINQLALSGTNIYIRVYYDATDKWDNWYTMDYQVLPVNKGGTGATDESNARENLGIGVVGTKDVINLTDGVSGIPYISGVLGVDYGGTGANTAEIARNNLSVYSKSEVDNKISPAIIGTWTPRFGSKKGTDPTYTTTEAKGFYKVEGKWVYISFFLKGNITDLGDSGKADACIKGLPFISAVNGGGGYALTIILVEGVTRQGGVGLIPENSDQIFMRTMSGDVDQGFTIEEVTISYSGWYLI